MMRPGDAVVVEGLTKSFEICTQRATSLKEMVVRNLFDRGERSRLTVLDDIGFRVAWGRSLAIVGGNGSGKSTLLKLLLGITPPDAGTIALAGRPAGLVELGAGFQLELTGMENVFLQGSLLGMSRRTILERLDRVLDFSELGQFIHTPMKRYSSGMIARLGFALAVNSDAEILLVDEVLAVGDSAFQSKCLQRIAEMRRSGRTILFVTHSPEHIELVADDVLWLEGGRIREMGPMDDVLGHYLAAQRGTADSADANHTHDGYVDVRRAAAMPGARPADSGIRIESTRFLNAAGQEVAILHQGEPFAIEVEIDARDAPAALDVILTFATIGAVRMAWTSNVLGGFTLPRLNGRHVLRADFPVIPFAPGRYEASVVLADLDRPGYYPDMRLNAYPIQVRGELTSQGGAILTPQGSWRLAAG